METWRKSLEQAQQTERSRVRTDPGEVQALGWRVVSGRKRQTKFGDQAGSCGSGVENAQLYGARQVAEMSDLAGGDMQTRAPVPLQGRPVLSAGLSSPSVPGLQRRLKSISQRERWPLIKNT